MNKVDLLRLFKDNIEKRIKLRNEPPDYSDIMEDINEAYQDTLEVLISSLQPREPKLGSESKKPVQGTED